MKQRTWGTIAGVQSVMLITSVLTLSTNLSRAQEATRPQTTQTAGIDDSALEEVTVTAQFRKQDLQQTPLSITAISGEQLGERGATQLVDVANSAPTFISSRSNKAPENLSRPTSAASANPTSTRPSTRVWASTSMMFTIPA